MRFYINRLHDANLLHIGTLSIIGIHTVILAFLSLVFGFKFSNNLNDIASTVLAESSGYNLESLGDGQEWLLLQSINLLTVLY